MAESRRLAILGGGMAGLTAAWELTRPGVDHGYERITVYQRGHRLGGKGASSRGSNDRIEEHGLHVWLGYYDNAFRMMRDCYDELDRASTRPECPIQQWTDAFEKASEVGVTHRAGEQWANWVASFAENDELPGEPDVTPPEPLDLARRCVDLLGDFFESAAPEPPSLYFSASPEPSPFDEIRPLYRRAVRTAHLSGLAMLSKLVSGETAVPLPFLTEQIEQLRMLTAKRLERDPAAQRVLVLVDLVSTCLVGLVSEGVMNDIDRLHELDDRDFQQWLLAHGALESTVNSGIVRGLYDLVFAYEDGDTTRPAFPAGLGLFLAGKIFFDYKGAIFWKMTAGMGDVVFAPMFEVLRARGVEFRFLHRIEELRLHDEDCSIETIVMSRQAPLVHGDDAFEPLTDYSGLPCFPTRIDETQLHDPSDADFDLESHFVRSPNEERLELRRGVDFDDVVLATSIGAVPVIAADLVERLPAWRRMIKGVPTVATQALQVWFRATEDELGAEYPGSTISGYVEPFDTWASMTHLLDHENWPDDVGSIAYFCSPLATAITDRSTPAQVAAQQQTVVDDGHVFLDHHAHQLLPALAEGVQAGLVAATYVRANVDPSDRYVRSQPGAQTSRLRSEESGVANLVLAGDWTDCGLNAGCIEAATLSGIQAANALLNQPRSHRVLGRWPGLSS